MMSKKIFSFLILLSLLLENVSSKDDYRFHTFSPKGGFFYDGIKSIVQDGDGFIWILQDDNILRLDGYEHKSYYPVFNSIDNHQKWFFNAMAVSPTEELYVTTNNGLFIYSRADGVFKSVLPGSVTELTIDSDNNIWLVHNGSLHQYNSQTSEIIPSLYEGNAIRHIAHFCAGDDGLYMATIYDRIFYCNYKENPNEISLFYKFPHTHNIMDIRREGNKLWVLTREHGLFKIDTETQQIEAQFTVFYEHEGEIVSPRKLHIDKTGKIWIGTRQGLFIFDPQTNLYQVYKHSSTSDFSLPNNSVWTIAEDARKNIWIGTFSGGLSYVNIEDRPWFQTYTTGRTMLNADLVSSFAEDDNNLWIGTDGGGINRMDKETGQFTFHHSGKEKANPLSNQVKSIVLDAGKNLWIAMFVGGLSHYDVENGRFTNYLVENGLLSNNLRKIVREQDHGLWIAYQFARPQISYFSFDTKQFTHYTLDEALPYAYIFDIQRGNDDYLWLATPLKLYKFDVKTHETFNIAPKEGFLNAQSLFIDKENNVWIGTAGNGLFKYNAENNEFTSFKETSNSEISIIYSICADPDNNLWLGTDNGLLRYNIENNAYTKFDEADGLQGQVYYPLAAMKAKDGKLYFGGTNGFSVINPQNITQNQQKPNVIISDFLIDNVSTLPAFKNENIGFSENTIILLHHQSNFGLKFSSDNYLIPQKNRFRYRLKGYDDRWITVDANSRTAFYSKIPAGTYQFEIMAANNDGIWSDTPSVIRIIRRPALWFSTPAYFIYTIIILSILGAIVHYFNDKRKLKMQLYLNNLDKQKKEEIHQSQLRFFTNISHDFGAPLFLILAAINNLKEEGVKKYYHRILHNNATRLLNLVNELMDFRTVENGKMQLQVQKTEINPMLKDLYLDFEDYAKKHNIDFNIALDSQLEYYQAYIDRQVLEKIIMNLLRNAFKYTHDGGEISVETYFEKSKFTSEYENFHTVANENTVADSFAIAIRDTGIGITKDSIKSVFDRFYKVKTNNADNHLGTGIGLALVKSLVLLHKGEVTLFSEREKGTDIIVSLPLDPAIYTDGEFLNTESESEQMIIHSVSKNNEPKNVINPASHIDDVSPKGKKRILLVEDNHDLRTLIAKFLSHSYNITEAENGAIAIDILKDTEIDLIVSDIMMPVKDGVSLLREVKNDINTSHIPVILLTAKTDLETKLQSSGLGADLYFEKPIDLHLLQLSIQNVFTQYRKLRERYAKNFFADSAELSTSEKDNKFLRKFTEVIENNLDSSEIDVGYIASELLVSRSKLYSKVKMLTDKSIVEFILQYRLRKAARILIEEDLPIYQVMQMIGIQSQSYFTKVFKKEFDETPTAFVARYRKGATGERA
jgi:signal transduction histidine kinase/ligand-binding sensor domain-containing protein/DNA-binding response OmpR family regulator